MNKVKTDPCLALMVFVKPNGTRVKINSFPASIEAAVALGWVHEKEFEAAAKAAPAPKKAPAGKK